jgi:hypothetical protein
MMLVVRPRNTLLAAACVALPMAAADVRAESETRYRIGEVHSGFAAVRAPRAGEAPLGGGAARGAPGAIVFSDDFEGGMGNWVVTDDAGVGAHWGDADCWSTSGTRSAACAAAGVQARVCGEDYLPGMKTWMVHGPFSLADSAICAAELRFSLKLDAEPGLDGVFVGTSTDGEVFSGAQFTGVVEGAHVMDLTHLLGRSQVWVGFRFHSDASVARPDGAQVDDVVVLRAPAVPGASNYGFTLSTSNTDPHAHRANTSPFIAWLWYFCSPAGQGLTQAEFTVSASGGSVSLAFVAHGFLNAGSGTTLILANPQCPPPPVVIAAFTVHTQSSPLNVCIDQCRMIRIEDCQTTPAVHSADFVGITNYPGGPCQSPTICGNPTSVATASWGAVKALYR